MVQQGNDELGVRFDPLVGGWFADSFAGPTPPQQAGWREIAAGRDVLIAAPTGSGKTLAAFLWAIDELVRAAREDRLADATAVIYVSPLKALGNDIEKNLAVPLAAIRERARAAGVDLQDIRVAVRTGDTPAAQRQAMLKHPPHVLITTPESLYILLTAEKSREMLCSARTVIVDEIHAVAGDKRGAHLALTLARLDALAGRRLQRVGLSATQKPIEEIARLLVGNDRLAGDGTPRCAIVDTGHKRAMELAIETTDLELGAITSHELRAAVYDRVVELVNAHRTTIVFVNTRRLVERVAHALGERLGAERVVAHHGSLSRRIRLEAEQKLKTGEVPVVVATASLELGIDVGHVDLVCHLGAPRALATLLQRVGRSGHWLGSVPKGIFFPLTRDELVQTAAAVRAIRQGELDRVLLPAKPLDILAQQMVATAASEEIPTEALWRLVRTAYPYRDLTRAEFDDVLSMLSEGVATRRGRRTAYLHHDRVQGRIRARRGARLAAITSGGAIPETADYDVIEEPTEAKVGKVNEDFAIESMRGDIFLLGNHSWRIRRVEAGRVRVEDAGQTPPTIPFWLGEAPARTRELSHAVSELRQAIADRLHDRDEAIAFLVEECGMDLGGATQLVAYVESTVAVLGTVPTCERIIAERFFDESGGMQLVLHAPFGGAINRAFGLALRKSFCLGFDFELQAAATDDGVVISLGEQHSFPLDGVFSMVRKDTLEENLVQAVLAAPMFGTRWRWNASRALALLRQQGGKRVPMNIQRMRAEDLLAAVFPAQLGCGDNRTGPIEPVDHPLVNETIANCLHEAMDIDGLRALLGAIERGEIRTVAVETAAPSPMAHELLNAYPYAFLDDAPLEERRARAVNLRRTDASLAQGIGALDQAAIDEVREQAWPDVRDPDELHDALLGFVWLPLDEIGAWQPWLDELIATRRAAIARWTAPDGGAHAAIVVAERSLLARAALPSLRFDTPLEAPPGSPAPEHEEAALDAAVRGWIACLGPVSTAQLATRLGLRTTAVEAALARCENDGVALRGRFTPGGSEEEWCERRLLARIHRLTIGRLRREIEPVSVADFMRFLFRWQHVAPGTQLHGRDGLAAVITQLHGVELPAPAWERSVFPLRVREYAPGLLDDLCFSGFAAWGRFSPPAVEPPGTPLRRRRSGPTRNAPLAVALREELPVLLDAAALREGEAMRGPGAGALRLTRAARDVLDVLTRQGASFLGDVARATGLLPSTAEEALWELVARGLVTGDGFAGLRTLLTPEEKRRPERRLRALRGGRASLRSLPVGRWALLRPRDAATADSPASSAPAGRSLRDPALEQRIERASEAMARILLRRYGVVLRELTAREALAPPWRHLLVALRRMEARGEVRGGRFVSGLVGEQFALPEAVEALRATRRLADDGEAILVASADPLNLVGILTPGARIPATSGQVIAFQRGVPVEAGELGAVRSRLQSHAEGA
ncbi:MAG: DEAD/DEAH box helicase [Thermodesulfobacteriota bacterium]